MLSFENLVVVAGVTFAAPFLLGLFPRVRLPSVVLEIVASRAIARPVTGVTAAALRRLGTA